MKYEVSKQKIILNKKWVCLACPVCNFEYNRVVRVKQVFSKDEWGCAWQGRGDAVKISMVCENNHVWTFVLGFHKGINFMTAEVENGEE